MLAALPVSRPEIQRPEMSWEVLDEEHIEYLRIIRTTPAYAWKPSEQGMWFTGVPDNVDSPESYFKHFDANKENITRWDIGLDKMIVSCNGLPEKTTQVIAVCDGSFSVIEPRDWQFRLKMIVPDVIGCQGVTCQGWGTFTAITVSVPRVPQARRLRNSEIRPVRPCRAIAGRMCCVRGWEYLACSPGRWGDHRDCSRHGANPLHLFGHRAAGNRQARIPRHVSRLHLQLSLLLRLPSVRLS
jgi:hypothetical protein